ncbi:MurR/RpiR family transcriptional regulator [Mesoplasma florum]|uniref:MurR/RpiR family transcriptional regulator n=1 Tax=Mesoplasma florum TaxID=2151 RepID=UPI000D025EFB|nr:MurR/RpiR family transcriptional regulator [Mesoplasma florum]AVN58926.1 hypothetical protein CG009_01635 [Mesoplasma florum]
MKLNLIEKLKKVIHDNKNQSYAEIANFILTNKEVNYDGMTIFKLAKKTNTSAPTITRFCKEIHLDGFKELIYLLKNNEHQFLGKIERESSSLPYFERMNSFKTNVINSLENSFNENLEKFLTFNEMLKTTNKIYFFGFGSNKNLIKFFSDLLVRMNFNVVFSDSTEQQMAYADNITEKDMIFIVSVSLSDPNFEWLFKKWINIDCQRVFITKNTGSSCLDKEKKELVIEIESSNFQVGKNFSTEISILFLLKSMLISLIDDELYELINRTNI